MLGLAGLSLVWAALGTPGVHAAASADTVRVPVFPVAHAAMSDVVSRLGEAREGGRRSHRGIDIAAPRGTLVLAVADAEVQRVERTPVGGLVVWLRESRSSRAHYFAHLQEALVHRGQRVRAGTPIGRVGTSGNAVGTRPHLHYQVFEGNRLVDPERFLGGARPSRVARAAGPTGSGRVRFSGAALKSAPGATIAVLRARTRVEILGSEGRYYRVRYGRLEGYLARWLVERG